MAGARFLGLADLGIRVVSLEIPYEKREMIVFRMETSMKNSHEICIQNASITFDGEAQLALCESFCRNASKCQRISVFSNINIYIIRIQLNPCARAILFNKLCIECNK